jgi:hypothetical protein
MYIEPADLPVPEREIKNLCFRSASVTVMQEK